MIACQKILKKFKKNFSKIDEERTNKLYGKMFESISKQIFAKNLEHESKHSTKQNSNSNNINNKTEQLSKENCEEQINEINNNNLRKEIKSFYADLFTNGNKISAKNSLQNRMLPNRNREMNNLSFNLGILTMQIVVFLFVFCLSNHNFNVDYDKKNLLVPFFPFFSFSLMIILCFFGLSLNIVIFKKYRINYIFIFDVDPRTRLTHTQILKVLFYLN